MPALAREEDQEFKVMLWLCSNFEASMDFMRSGLENQNKLNKKQTKKINL